MVAPGSESTNTGCDTGELTFPTKSFSHGHAYRAKKQQISEKIKIYKKLIFVYYSTYSWLDFLQREDPVLLFCHGDPCKN